MNPSRLRQIAVICMLLLGAYTVGSGAFTAITADRSATINAAGDASALLGIEGHSSVDQSFFGTGATFSLQVTPGETTTYSKFLNITNQGSQPVAIWITDIDNQGSGGGDSSLDIVGFDEDNTANVTFFNSTYGGNGSCENGFQSVEGQDNAVEVGAGQTLVVGLHTDVGSVSEEEADLLDEITIHADANVNGQSEELVNPC